MPFHFFCLDSSDKAADHVGKGVFVVVVVVEGEEGVDWQVKGDGIKNVGTRAGGQRDRLELISLKDLG